ncbi:MAG: sel1 repeat family protein [Bacteroidaceae bacterium]|nr:sel1 repeat family protein [Bacteroidaceae bacterium]
MNKFLFFTLLVSALSLTSCLSDSKKADKLRLDNKFEEAAELYQKAADEGDAYAKWRLSKAYANGDGVDYDEDKALKLLKEASKEGCEEAICDLAYAYMFGWYNMKVDEKKGKTMLDGLVKRTDNAYVLTRFAKLLFFGSDLYEKDIDRAMSILSKIKDKNNAEYLLFMGVIFVNGTDEIDVDGNKVVDYCTKAFNKGRRYSAYLLAGIYQNGFEGIKKDKNKYIEWLNQGIKANVTECMTETAQLCFSEDSIYQDIHNPHRGIELLIKASKHGSGEAYTNLGYIYYEGKYVNKNDKKAFEYYQKATKLKNASGAFHLGLAYIDGKGCDKDVKKGIETWELASDYGSGAAANNLFCYYSDGMYTEDKNVIDKKLAKKYLLRSAELRDDVGCYNLARRYYWGNDLFEKDDSQAFVYMKIAADQGYVDACEWLSYFYKNGIGCDKNPQKAKEYKDKTIAKEDRK